MSLFIYIIDLPNQLGKEGRLTAKTEKDAKEQIVAKYPQGKNLLLEAQPNVTKQAAKKAVKVAVKKTAVKKAAVKKAAVKKVAVKKTAAKKAVVKKVAVKKTAVKGLNKLEQYIYLQHGNCFFCGEKLTPGNATIEHLNPVSKGGTRTEDNEVACCAAVNHTFGDMDLKRKFEFVLRASNAFKCPQAKGGSTASAKPEIVVPATLITTPENHGMAWTEKEEKQLLSRYSQNMSIEDIAKKHKRGFGGITAKLEKLGKLQVESNVEPNGVKIPSSTQ